MFEWNAEIILELWSGILELWVEGFSKFRVDSQQSTGLSLATIQGHSHNLT